MASRNVAVNLADGSSNDYNKVYPSVYVVQGQDIYQKLAPGQNIDTYYGQVSLAPTFIRAGNADDAMIAKAYLEYFTRTSVMRPLNKEPAVPSTTYTSIPSNYVYNTNHFRPTLHDYCTASPDAYRDADFRGPCARHDMCIEGNLWRSWWDRRSHRSSVCDPNLYWGLTDNCKVYHWSTRSVCNSVSAFYYAAVSTRTQFT